MRLLTLFLSVLLLSCFVLAQQKYLVTPDQDVIPLRKGESASAVIAKRMKRAQSPVSSVTNSCPSYFHFGFDPNAGFPDNGNFGSNHKDVMAEWFQAKASGKIDTIFWLTGGTVGAKDSLIYLRVHNSNIT
ncbi:MAG: hypothetical protein HY277_02705, partial [Ignavibacteriales bacterium]|nr:hypothetical protein [Ignavibacteriales bacterium]